ncbi:MAG: rRNA maturation RNase YbeY [Candidatus Kapabacteria bacterium]|nr:rRNA maturation RNase YbeY [Candidatus Kapabacteria bacterium]
MAVQWDFDITITNGSALRRIPRAKMLSAVERALRGERSRRATVSVVILDDPEIHRMNKQYLNHDYPTDVITFSMSDDSVDGEIYIGAGVAVSQAAEYGVTVSAELQRLAVHGTLHLLGYDDNTPDLRKTMNDLETSYIT